MAHQSPMISIPRKTTDEVDWTTPIRNLIAQSYGENPDNYASECAQLQRCRQDAVKGAGSDMTARDLLYKYFGQLELLELRFSEIRVNFPWRDAFTNKLITQTSIAYEKASILFQIASTHSAIAAAQSRFDPEGTKRAFHYFRTCAGMLNYINENFLHAPSTDLSREVIKFLVGIILAQATEVFFEKCVDEKKANALVAKIGSQAAGMYTTLTEDVKEFMGKGIFDRNWVTLVQIKAKYFTSLAQYYRGLADSAAGKHGESLVRFIQAETLAKEAHRLASSFSSSFVAGVSATLPADAGPSIAERTKGHHLLCQDKKNEAQRENDLIYNAILPAYETLPAIEKLVVANPIHIHEVYGTPEVQKTIGQDFFIKLIPLSVHESASVYSEEKAKLVRGEVENAESAEVEARSALEAMGVKEGLMRFRAMAEGEVGEEIPLEVSRWKKDISFVEDREPVSSLLAQLGRLKEGVRRDLDGISNDLDVESRECEAKRVQYGHTWSQDPAAGLTKNLRQELKSHLSALEAASASDLQVSRIWDSVRGDIQLLLGADLEQLFRDRAGSTGAHLLDLDGVGEDDDRERAKIGGYVQEIDERLGRLNKISRERGEVLKDLKEKVQSDDVSHLLLINRRNTGVEPALFKTELEKFRPYQQRLATTVQYQEAALGEIAALWKNLRDLAGRGPGARKWEEREKRKKETVRRFEIARDGYMEVRDGLAKGLQFYNELTDLTAKLKSNAKNYVNRRTEEREALAAKLETEKRLSAASVPSPPPPLAAKPRPPPPPRSQPSLDSAFGNMSLKEKEGIQSPQQQQPWGTGAYPPPQQNNYGGYGTSSPQQPPPPPQQQPYFPPPPPRPTSQQYGSSSPYPPPPPQQQYATPPPPPPPQQQPSYPPPMNSQGGFLPPPPSRPSQSSFSPAPTPSAPPADPYASLAMFNTEPPQQQQNPQRQGSYGTSMGGYSSPQPPQQQGYQQQQYQQYQQSAQPYQQQQQQPQQAYQQQQQQHFGAFPPPPPPPPQQSYGGSHQGYGGGYGGYGQ